MTCPHTNWTLDADLRLDGGCIQCWKERCERAEAACAQKDEALKTAVVFNPVGKNWFCYRCGTRVPNHSPSCQVGNALSSSCGHGYLPPDKAKVLVEALEFIFGGCYCTCGQPAELCGCAETIANKALDKVKEAQ